MIGEKEILAAINSISTTLATGTLTTSSTTVPADTGRTEVDHYWDGCILMPISGVDAFQPRIINSFANAGGVFTLDTPLTTAPGLVTYSILPNQIPAVLATLNMAVPAPDSIANVIMRDVVGNKADTSKYSIAATQSLVAMLKGVLASSIVTNGTFTTSSATVPADTGRAEATNFWNGCTLIPLTGADAFQPRVIKSFNNAGGVFTMDIAFTAATGTVAYIILPSQIPADVATILADLAVPGADVVTNTLERDVVGNKTDAAKYAPAATQSIIAMLKGLLGSSLVATGTFTTSSSTVPADTGRAEASSYWKGCILLPLTGSDAFQPRYIIGFNNIGGVFTVDPNNPFTAVTGLVAYAILAAQTDFVPAADSVNNNQPEDVIGNKTDTNSGNSIMASQKVQAADNAANVLSRDVIGNKTDTVSSGSLQGLNRVQTADNAANTNMRDVVGNKADTASTTINGTTSIMRYLKGIMGWFLVPGADSAADTVERDVVGDKTDTASTTINGTTSLMRYLKGLLGLHPVPAADSANNINMRDVIGNKTDTILSGSLQGTTRAQFADSAANNNMRDVIGNKTDTVVQAVAAGKSIMGYIKGLITSIGNPSAHTLVSLTAKWGNIARDLTTILGARWNAAGDLGTDIAAILVLDDKKVIGKTQIFVKAIASAANAGAVVAATITTQSCLIKSIVVRSNAATTADLTNITIKGGAGLVVTFIDAVTGVRANIAAADQQVAWTGAVALVAAKTITITLTGTGATAVDLTITFEYEALVDGGYLA
jgi:hypothetical protein